MLLYRKPEVCPTRGEGYAESCHCPSKTPFPIVVSGATGSEGSQGFTTAAGSEKTSGGSTGPGTTLEGRAGMEMQGGKPLPPDLREVASGF